ncbi:MAG TPA: hypothetical protein G4N96_08885 [Chloroflexi bacterium]|nr:MAG: hypothetical protein B6I38_07545 [Anaerolineaceae bacterium 4572_5.1]HEY85208.1 hypothetical protein [Chloroflexota bacterium]
MNLVKQQMIKIIKSQPDDSVYEDILRELALALMIERGLKDSRTGRTISNQEMKKRIQLWQT